MNDKEFNQLRGTTANFVINVYIACVKQSAQVG